MHHANRRELPRQDIVRTLARSISAHYLTVITAPAGYGKTTIAHKLLGHNRKNRFFYSVPDDIANTAHWWDSLFSSLAKQGLEAAPFLRRMGFPQNDSTVRRVVDAFRDISPSFLLIIDDCQNFGDPAVAKFMETLIRAEPSDHRFVLFSRSRSRMNLAGLIRDGLAAAYDQTLLEFSEEEATRFFFLNGVSDREASDRAWRYSEGWATALWLCLQNHKTGHGTPPAEDVESLLDNAVFAAYSEAEQNFLIQLSVLDSFTPAEAESILPIPELSRRLREMSDGNALIRFDRDVGKYVFHSIFREFLGKKLAARPDLNIPRLYRRAAECHMLRREYMTACRLLAKAGRDGDLVRILDVLLFQNGQNTVCMLPGELREIVLRIPWRLRLRQPLGYMVYLWYNFDGFDPQGMRLFEEADGCFKNAREIPPYLKRRLEGELEFVRAWLHMYDDRKALERHYARACELLDGPSVIRYDRMCWNFHVPHLLSLFLMAGQRFGRDVLPMSHAVDTYLNILTGGVSEGCIDIGLVEFDLERGLFENAEQRLDDIEQRLDPKRNATSTILARFSRARFLAATGRPEDGLAALRELMPAVEASDFVEHIQCLELAVGYALANAVRPETAPGWLRDCDIFGPPYGDDRTRGFMATVCGRLLLAKGDLDGLSALLTSRPDVFGPVELLLDRVNECAFRAVLAWRDQDEETALGHLGRAVELTRPDGLVLSLAEFGGHILPLLHRLRRGSRNDPHLKKLIELTEAVDRSRRRLENGLQLSDRECEVMRMVVKGKSTPAIAKKMGTVESTIKKQLASVYRKLGTKNRAEAASRFQAGYCRKAEKRSDCQPAEIPEKWLRAREILSDVSACLEAVPPEPDRNSDENSGEKEKPLPDEPVARNRALGERYAARGDLAEALHFFLRAGRDEDLAEALGLFTLPGAGELTAYCFDEVCEAVEAIPWRVRVLRPMGYLSFLWMQLRTSGARPSNLTLGEAEYHFSRAEFSEAEYRRLAGEMALVRGVLAAEGASAFWDRYDLALALLPGPSELYTRETSWTFGNPAFLFSAVGKPGKPGEAAALAERSRKASPALSTLTGGRNESLHDVFRMELHLERGELLEAGSILPELAECRDADLQTTIVAAFAGARMFLAKGQDFEAVELLEDLRPDVERLGSYEISESFDLALGFVHAQLGRVDLIAPWIRAGRTACPPHGSAGRRPFALTVYGKALAAAGEYRLLDSAARTMPGRFGRYDSLLGRIHGKVLEALAARQMRGDDEALAHMREALELSRPDGLMFSIAEYGVQIISILRRLRQESPRDNYLERVTILADRMRRFAASGARGTAKPELSRREHEIMRHVIQGQSNPAIARALGVSVSSVQKTLSSAYVKLGAANRAEASRAFDQVPK